MRYKILKNDSCFTNHVFQGHDENPARLQGAVEAVRSFGLAVRESSRSAADADILKVHSREYLDYLKAVDGLRFLSPDTCIDSSSLPAARYSSGVCIEAANLLADNDFIYCLNRPPGHHAERESGKGFCVLNNMAILIEYLREVKKQEKFLVLDLDAHCGDGTEKIYYADPSVVYFSLHANPLTTCPGWGFASDLGEGAAEGTKLNVPLPLNASSGVLDAITKLFIPIAKKIKPDVLLISAGFDGHYKDPMRLLGMGSGHYAEIARLVKEAKVSKKVIAVTEGGYDKDAVADAMLSFVDGFVGFGYEPKFNDSLPENHTEVTKTIKECKRVFSGYWDVL